MTQVNYCLKCGSKLSTQNIDGRDYQACSEEGCDYVFWDNPLPVVAALIEYQGNVLLARNKLWGPKMFGLITGFLEKGESPENAVLREVKEELDLDAAVESLIGLYAFERQNQLLIVYHLKAEGAIKLSEELVEVISLPPEKVRPWNFGTGPAVRDWLTQRGIDPK